MNTIIESALKTFTTNAQLMLEPILLRFFIAPYGFRYNAVICIKLHIHFILLNVYRKLDVDYSIILLIQTNKRYIV